MALNLTYRDVNPFFGLNTLPALVRHDEAINSSIGNILGIHHGERWYYPQFGSWIRRYVWEPLDQITANKIFQDVVLALSTWEPRIKILPQTAVIANPVFQRFDVDIYYTIIENQRMGQFTAHLKSGATTRSDLITGPSAAPSPMIASGRVLTDSSGAPILDEDGEPIYENV